MAPTISTTTTPQIDGMLSERSDNVSDAPQDTPGQRGSSEPGGLTRILVIDDNALILNDFRKILAAGENNVAAQRLASLEAVVFATPSKPLEQPAFLVDGVQDGEQGRDHVLQACREGRPYAVAFVDMRMPGGWCGLKTVEELWRVDPEIQVVICTAYADYSWDEITARLGRSDRLLILRKPFEKIEVLQLAIALTDKWRLNRERNARLAELERRVEDRTRDLRASEQRFRDLFHHSPLPSWIYSTATRKILEVNDEAIAKYGYSREEFLSMTLNDLRSPEDIERLTKWFQPPPADRSHTTDWRHRRKDGQVFDVDIYLREIDFAGEPARLAVMIDITARKEAERQTQRLFETSLDLILVTDSYGRLLQVSPSAATVLGYAPEEMTGRNGEDFVLSDDLEAVRKEMRAARTGGALRGFRWRCVHRDGHTVALAFMGTWSEADRKHFFIGRDMTEYERTEAQLRQAQKMEAVGQLTGGVAHDFNNILMVIMANAESLEEEEGLDRRLQDGIKEIAGAAKRAGDLTRQLLAFSRKQPLRPQLIKVHDLAAGTGKLLRRTLGEHIQIESILADNLWPVEIDPAQLESALVNLSINARDAMPNGGRLLIEARNTTLDEDDVRKNPDVSAGDYVTLAVSDTGTGMPPEVAARVFEPFFTTKGVGKGTGLGLSMVYGFIKQSNGHIKIYSEVGQGTTIKLYLPRSDRPDEQTAPQQSLTMPRGAESILVVEDDEQVRLNVVDQLRGLGYTTKEAPDAREALATLEAASHPCDVLLTDIVMPGEMNGRALADEVKRRFPDTKIVFMSGYTAEAVIRGGRLDPGVLLLSKPFRKRDLAEILRHALDGRGGSNDSGPAAPCMV